MNKIMSLNEFANCAACGANPSEESEEVSMPDDSTESLDALDLDDSILDELVELVGSEEDIEAAASAAFDDLTASFERNEIEMTEEDIPEKLAIASLVVKLVELGKLDPDDADSFIEKHLD